MDKIIVIGAGIAGLTAAYSLQKHGFDVQVIEASPRVGGRMTTDTIDGYTIDCGAQFLSSAYPILNTLIFELGLQDEFITTSPWAAIRRNNIIHKFRYNDIFSPVNSGLLNWVEWFKLGLKSTTLIRQLFGKQLNDFSSWEEFDTQSTAEWYNAQYGAWMTEYVIEPVLEGFYFQSPEETSRALSIAVSGFLGRRAKTMTLKHGIGSLPSTLASKLNITLNEKVNQIIPATDKVYIHTNRQEIKADRAILAVPAHIAKQIYVSQNQYVNALLDTLYSSTINLVIGMNKEWNIPLELTDVYGLLIPRHERKHIVAIAIETAKYAERSKSGHLLNIMIDGKSGSEMIEWNDENIFQALVSEIDTLFPSFSNSIVFYKLYRWKYAEPKSPIGRAKNIDKYRKQVSQKHRVLLAGDYMGMPFTEGAAETGLWAASSIMKGYEIQ